MAVLSIGQKYLSGMALMGSPFSKPHGKSDRKSTTDSGIIPPPGDNNCDGETDGIVEGKAVGGSVPATGESFVGNSLSTVPEVKHALIVPMSSLDRK